VSCTTTTSVAVYIQLSITAVSLKRQSQQPVSTVNHSCQSQLSITAASQYILSVTDNACTAASDNNNKDALQSLLSVHGCIRTEEVYQVSSERGGRHVARVSVNRLCPEDQE